MRHTSPSSGNTVDDGYLAKMIFDDTPHQLSPLVTSQNSPLHKSTSALHDITEMPRPISPSAHRHITGTRSLAYPPGPYQMDRSFSSSYTSDFNDSFPQSIMTGGSLDRSPRATSSGSRYLDESALRGGNLTDDVLQHYSPHGKTSSPGSHGRSSLDSRGYYPTSGTGNQQVRSSPDSMYSPSHHRSSYRSSAGLLSPEPMTTAHSYPLPPPTNLQARSRPQSSHSTGTPPPSDRQVRGSAGGMPFKDREMNLQEALLMDQEFTDQDEGTLV